MKRRHPSGPWLAGITDSSGGSGGLSTLSGPVRSRWTGRSLRVTPIPAKTCNYSCAYCHLGRISSLTNTRRDFYPARDVLSEIQGAVKLHRSATDVVTFVGDGEPTLCRSLGYLVDQTRKLIDRPVAVITNGGLLHREDVRQELAPADVLMGSLCATDHQMFRKLNCPHEELRIEEIVEGLTEFRRSFEGRLWIEVMLVRGVNDGQMALQRLHIVLSLIHPDRTFINIPVRQPAQPWVKWPGAGSLLLAQLILRDAEFVHRREEGEPNAEGVEDPADEVPMILHRHAMRIDQICAAAEGLSRSRVEVDRAIEALEAEGKIQRVVYQEDIYFGTGTALCADRDP